MTEFEMQDLLNTKLKQYLLPKNKELEISQIIELINLQIIETFNCDKEKLIDALEFFNRNIVQNQNMKFADLLNKIEISSSGELFVKGFLSKNNPMLFFYYGDDDSPFAKITTDFGDYEIKYSIEISNNSKVLADFKKGKFVSNSYLTNVDYIYRGNIVEKNKNVFAETKLVENSKFLNVTNESNYLQEYVNFLNLIRNANQYNKIDLSKISGFSLEILFNNFYDEIKNLCFDEYNLSLENIIYLINSTVYNDNSKNLLKVPNSKFVQIIENLDNLNEFSQKRKMKIRVDNDNESIEYDVIKSDKYLSIDVKERGKKKCGLMVISTADGFSAFVSNGNSKLQSKPAFVINFSAGQIKIMTVDDKSLKTKSNKFEMNVILNDGFLKFSSFSSDYENMKSTSYKNIEDYDIYVYSAKMQ